MHPAPNQVKLSAHVTRTEGQQNGKYPYGNPLTVTAGNTTVLLDSALGIDPSDADLLLLSHYHEDHVAGTGARRGPTEIHEFDLPAIQSWNIFRTFCDLEPGPWEADMREQFQWTEMSGATAFDHRSTFEVGGSTTITVVPLPGHTAGHCGFLVEPDGVFYLADVELSSFGPFYGDRHSSLADTRTTLQTCATIDAAVYTTFHHKGPYTSATEFRRALAHHAQVLDDREDKILTLLTPDGARIEDLVGNGVVYRLGRRPWYADHVERSMCRRHLDELVSNGVVTGPDPEGFYRVI